MPVHNKTTRQGWIVACSNQHLEQMERMSSTDQLLLPDRQTPKKYSALLRLPAVSSTGTPCVLNGTHCTAVETVQQSDIGGVRFASAPDAPSINHNGHLEIVEPVPRSLKDQVVPPTRRALKNLLVLATAVMLVLTAFVSLQSLQSSMNAHQGLGVLSLSCLYGATVLSCFFAPAVIRKLTTKWTIALSYCFFILYIASNVYPAQYVMMPASILLGAATGPLWSAQSTYLTTLALRYAQASDQLQEATINRFNGVFCGILQTSQIWGNLISGVILSSDNHTTTVSQIRINVTLSKLRCGARDCGLREEFPDHSLVHWVSGVPPGPRLALLGVQAGCVLTAIVMITTLLDRNQSNLGDENSPSLSLSSQQLFFATVKMLQDPRLQLLMPLVTFTGLEQGFVLGDFTKSYVNCALGIHRIGFVMMCFGGVNAACSLCVGHVARHLKRYPIMVACTLFSFGLLLVLLWWRPAGDDVAMFYVVASCMGLCDAIWQTQTNTLFGVLFSDCQEAAFACYRMFQAIGFAIAFGYSHILCVYTKVYIMAGVLVVGLVLYSVTELKLHKTLKLRQNVVVL